MNHIRYWHWFTSSIICRNNVFYPVGASHVIWNSKFISLNYLNLSLNLYSLFNLHVKISLTSLKCLKAFLLTPCLISRPFTSPFITPWWETNPSFVLRRQKKICISISSHPSPYGNFFMMYGLKYYMLKIFKTRKE